VSDLGNSLAERPAALQQRSATPKMAERSELIDEIREQWKRRQAWHRAEKSLTLQAKAMCRRLVGGDIGDAEKLYQAATKGKEHPLAHIATAAMMPLLGARDHIEPQRKAVEKRLAKLAKELPVAAWVEEQRGVGVGSLAAIVGEAGDIAKYGNPAKLWKRMGMAVMPDGKRQRRVEGVAALEHGYSPSRRSVMWNIGDCMVKAGGPWRELYDTRKAYEIETATAAGITVCPSAKIPKKNQEAYRSSGHVHNRAKRYIEKRFLRDLWKAWRRTTGVA
jgi:hypothetical protein